MSGSQSSIPRFLTFLPLLCKTKSRKTAHQIPDLNQSMARFGQLKVLLAEDSLVNQKVIAGLLERQGSTVTVANNGRAAFRGT